MEPQDNRRDAGPGAPPTRRDFLATSAALAAGATVGAAAPDSAAAQQPAEQQQEQGARSARGGADAYALAARFGKYLRVTDVTDGLDALGRADKCLLDPAIRPLWMGVRFWGPAVTMRVIPTSRPMPIVSRKDALRQHAIWGETGSWFPKLEEHVKKGCVVVTATSGAKETGYWGSNNSMDMQSRGVAGIVTEGNARDTDEIIL